MLLILRLLPLLLPLPLLDDEPLSGSPSSFPFATGISSEDSVDSALWFSDGVSVGEGESETGTAPPPCTP